MGTGDFRRLRPLRRWTLGACGLRACLALAFTLLAFPVQAQVVNANGTTARAQVAMQESGSVLNVADMNFGRIAPATTAGTVIVTPAATATCTVTGGLVRSGTCRAAEFSIYGRRNNKVRIRENNGGVVTLTGPGGATMSMTNITIGTVGMSATGNANGWNLGNYQINTTSGITTFYLGGRLNVGANQAPGVYNGTVVIQIQFN